MPPTTKERLDAISQNNADMAEILDKYIKYVIENDAEKALLRAEITRLVADDAEVAAKVETAFNESEANENKARAGLPGVPPVGGQGLLNSYASKADFDAAVLAYNGPEAVTIDIGDGTGAIEVKAGTTPALAYYTHSADGSVSTLGPTD